LIQTVRRSSLRPARAPAHNFSSRQAHQVAPGEFSVSLPAAPSFKMDDRGLMFPEDHRHGDSSVAIGPSNYTIETERKCNGNRAFERGTAIIAYWLQKLAVFREHVVIGIVKTVGQPVEVSMGSRAEKTTSEPIESSGEADKGGGLQGGEPGGEPGPGCWKRSPPASRWR